MKAPTHSRLPGSLRILCDTAADYSVSAEKCLEGTNLTTFDLYGSETKVTFKQEVLAIQNFLRHARYREGLGIEMGYRIKPEDMGIWGYAVLTSPTVRASLLAAMDYSRLSFVIARMDLIEHGNEAMISFDISYLPSDVRKFVLERHLTVFFNFASASLPKGFAAPTVFRTTEYEGKFASTIEKALGATVEKSDRVNALVFSRDLLDLPLPKHDPELLAMSLKQCENLQGGGNQYSWSSRVHDAVLSEISNSPSIKAIAQSLNTSDRTLTRRLSEEGTSFRKILVRARLAIAHELLSTTSMSVSKVSWHAGYAEPSSFVRAFTKEYGYTPGKVGANH